MYYILVYVSTIARFQILLPRPGGMGRSFFEYIYIYMTESLYDPVGPIVDKCVSGNSVGCERAARGFPAHFPG